MALGWLRDARAIELLSQLKTHRDPVVRRSLAHTLSCFDSGMAIRALIELTRDAHEVVRDWATFDLCNMEADTPEIREALLARLDDPDAQTCFEAMVGLAERHDIRVVKAVLRAFEPGEDGTALFDHINNWPADDLLPALRAMIRDEAHRGNKDLIAAIRACAAYRRGL